RLSHDLPAMCGIRDIARYQDALAPGRFDETLRLLRIFVLVQIADEHVGAFARERERDGSTDAGVRPGDDRLLVEQAARTFVGFLAVVRRRLHSRARARKGLRLMRK